jgi:hypothetical protein
MIVPSRRVGSAGLARLALPVATWLLTFALGAPGASARAARLDAPARIFVECPRLDCDQEFWKREPTFVTFVRDPHFADLHVLVTAEPSGGGGEIFTLTFLGRGPFEGMKTVLSHAAGPADTADEIRGAQLRLLELGLVPFVASSPARGIVGVDYGRRTRGDAPTPGPAADPWDSWVARVEVAGAAEGEARQRVLTAEGELSIDRITPLWKFEAGVRGEWEHGRFELKDRVVVDDLHEWGARTYLIRALGEHWGVGAKGFARSSTFENRALWAGGGRASSTACSPTRPRRACC